MKRRFEFVGGSSAKFYELSVQGTTVTIQYGRLGTSGQASARSFADSGTAIKHAEKLIREKLGKGYRECVAS